MAKDLLQTLLDLEKENKTSEIEAIINRKDLAGDPVLEYYLAHLYYIGYIYCMACLVYKRKNRQDYI